MPDDVSSFAGPGGIRPIRSRWVVLADAVLETAAHLGGQGDGPTDMPLLRDAREGKPLLPGTSLAGALRSHLADVLCGYDEDEHGNPYVSLLFGDRQNTEKEEESTGGNPGKQSPLIVFDSLGTLPEDKSIEIRDGVAIEPKTGTAEEKKKFDYEVIPAGTTFPIRVELVVEETEKEDILVSLLLASLSGLADGEISVGARRSRGFGRLCIRSWRAHRYDLSSAEGWLSWLLTDPEKPLPQGVLAKKSLREALESAWPGWKPRDFEDKRQRLLIELQLSFSGGILVRSSGTTADAPDAVHLKSSGKPVLPGTGLAGVLRNRALRIARIVRQNLGDAELWVSRVFGPRFEGGVPPAGFKMRASRLRISESVIEGGYPMRPSRIRLDRFTQGVFLGALFDEEPIYGGTAAVRLELHNPQAGEAGLLLLLVKDLLSGDLTVGGTASVGRGILKGSARIQFEDGTTVEVSSDKTLPKEQLERLNGKIAQFMSTVPA